MAQLIKATLRVFIHAAVAACLFCRVSPVSAQDMQTGSRVPTLAIPELGAGSNLTGAAYAQGRREAPGLLKAASVACTITQAAYVGTLSYSDSGGQKRERTDLYEAACSEGLGYFVDKQKNKEVVAFDCIEAARFGKVACMLPQNRLPAHGLDPYLKAAGVKCSALRARFISEDVPHKTRHYEVACEDGGGYILNMPLRDGKGAAPEAFDCLQAQDDCTMTPHVESVAILAHKVGATLGNSCQISDARYVGYVAAKKDDLYEFACQNGSSGLLIELDAAGVIQSHRRCQDTKLVGAICELKPVKAPDPLIAYAQHRGASPPIIAENPDWIRKPDGYDLAKFYPIDAARYGLAGQATLSCRTSLLGLLQDCLVVEESPAGYGFGDAALKILTKFRMKPGTKDGAAVGGAHVIIPIDFAVGRR